MRRKGTANFHRQKRIPKDVRSHAAGLSVVVQIEDERVPYTISETAESIRISLRTPIPVEIKVRNAEVAAFFEKPWAELRAPSLFQVSTRWRVPQRRLGP